MRSGLTTATMERRLGFARSTVRRACTTCAAAVARWVRVLLLLLWEYCWGAALLLPSHRRVKKYVVQVLCFFCPVEDQTQGGVFVSESHWYVNSVHRLYTGSV